MNTINKFEQPNTEQADRRCAFSRSFTRMFDRLCAFLDERIGGASELIDACQSVADRFWHSKLYFPVCFMMLAVFMAVGQPVIGGVLVMSTLIFLLLFCDDLLSILFPVVLLAMVGTEFYDELYSLLRFWWIGLLAAAALLVHIGAMPAHRATAAACTVWWPCRSQRCSAASALSPARSIFRPPRCTIRLVSAS